MGAKKLSSQEKAAIVLLALGEDLAADIVKEMSPDEVRRIGLAMSRLGRVEPAVVDTVMAEFHDGLVTAKPTLRGDASSAKRLLMNAMGGANGNAALALDQTLDLATPALVETLAEITAERLATFLRSEHPQTIALVLAHADAAKAGDTLKRLPQTLHTEVIRRIADLAPVDPETIYELEASLRDEVQRSGHHAVQKPGGVDKVVGLIGGMDKAAGERLLADLEARDPELAKAVKERLFKFADLLKIDDRGIQELLKQVQMPNLMLALKNAPEELTAHILKNMSARAAQLLKEDMAAMPKTRLQDVEAAQRQIAQLARRLVEEGRIIMRGAGDVYV